jgi:transposase
MEPENYFSDKMSAIQKRYEAIRAFYKENLSAKEAAKKYGFSETYFKKLRFEFRSNIRMGKDPFFQSKKPGPKERRTDRAIIEKIIAFRKRNFSILDIRTALEAEKQSLSLDAIDKILKSAGFAPLPKRTRQERNAVLPPKKIKAPKTERLEISNETFHTETGAGPLIFLPLIENLGITEAIERCGLPKTNNIDATNMVLSFLCLKLMGGGRWSHDVKWNMDRALGLFSGLNVLPKSTTLSTYSYRVTREHNIALLLELSSIFTDPAVEEGEFNLDFKAIPHWGDSSVLEKNWSGSKSKVIKSILAVLVQDPATGFLNYSDAEVKHRNQNEAVLDFVDFWKKGHGIAPKMLIFDSKFTTYQNLNKLNKAEIGFLTIRRRSKSLTNKINSLSKDDWTIINLERTKRKYQKVKIFEEKSKLRNYDGEVRQIIITDHGRLRPTVLITNDFDLTSKEIIQKYSRRWLVEQEIAEQIAFFHLNHPSSSIVVKVDFDLVISLFAHNLYKLLSNSLSGFENCTVETIHRNFLNNGAKIEIRENSVTVSLKKKTHLPILFQLPWMKMSTCLSWHDFKIKFNYATTT